MHTSEAYYLITVIITQTRQSRSASSPIAIIVHGYNNPTVNTEALDKRFGKADVRNCFSNPNLCNPILKFSIYSDCISDICFSKTHTEKNVL